MLWILHIKSFNPYKIPSNDQRLNCDFVQKSPPCCLQPLSAPFSSMCERQLRNSFASVKHKASKMVENYSSLASGLTVHSHEKDKL